MNFLSDFEKTSCTSSSPEESHYGHSSGVSVAGRGGIPFLPLLSASERHLFEFLSSEFPMPLANIATQEYLKETDLGKIQQLGKYERIFEERFLFGQEKWSFRGPGGYEYCLGNPLVMLDATGETPAHVLACIGCLGGLGTSVLTCWVFGWGSLDECAYHALAGNPALTVACACACGLKIVRP